MASIEVLVVDDSAFMRKVVSNLLEEEEDIKVIDKARNGADALRKIEQQTPDVVTLDVEMPKMDGLEFLERLMAKCPIPVVMLSSVTTKQSKTTIKALELGAFDFITKPSGSISLDIDKVQQELIQKVRLAADSKVKKKIKRQIKVEQKKKTDTVSVTRQKRKTRNRAGEQKVVLIGASTGGPRSLKEVVTTLPADLNATVLIVQHMPAGFTKSLAQRLDKLSKIEVKEAEDGDQLIAGQALVAPGDYHLTVKNGKVELSQSEKVHNVRPAIDKTIASLVREYQESLIGVLLTGMGKDGAKGLGLIKEFGGQTIAQDEKTSVVYGMPKVAYESGVVDTVKPLYQIGEEIIKKVEG
ncbi:chemotaxis response regulator protein-glutamate methylesterase [Natroniella acetigena]|uniref:protein-glutamate methylesterase/protein-glutamine glutaminase n=1 Tax=Natroniella acetigena TaxID=52004 RepID=UPI00200B2EB7|nr:chemotaxis response regulator protein-glutamate methylesterase [Natroniella acetigena]